jgi:hypothetical protein
VIVENGNYWVFNCGEMLELVDRENPACDGVEVVVERQFEGLQHGETGAMLELRGGVYLVRFVDIEGTCIMLEHELRRPGERTWVH